MAISVAWRLVDVQIAQHTSLSTQAAAQHQSAVVLPGQRGEILDRNGHVLASNQAVYDVYADPSLIAQDQRSAVADQLAPILAMGPGKLIDLLNQQTRFVYLSKGVSEDVKTKLASLNQPGIGVIAGEQRVYDGSPLPGASFAAQLLGYVNSDGKGNYGVEGYYNSILQGSDGTESTIRDLAGNSIVLSHQSGTQARNGQNLELGLDSQVQYWAEQAIAKGVTDAQAGSGELLVMDAKTGSIRAWAQYPTYNANSYATSDVANFRDRAIADLYEPGSVEKVVTYAGGLDTHAITPAVTFHESNTTIDGYTIHDWDYKNHGLITFQTALDESLNNGAIQVMDRTGHDDFYRTLQGFGIGAPTGVDLAGEQNQPLPAEAKWSDINYATAAFGQGIVVTPIEMLAAVNAVANGGVWVQPHAVDAIIDPATGKQTPFTPTTRRVVSAATAATLSQMMTGVVEDKGGEGFMAKIPGFTHQVAGKTGTADEPTNGQYQGDLAVSFGGFLPASSPQYTALVVLHHPTETRIQRFGAFLAAPVWKQISQVIIDQWRIVP